LLALHPMDVPYFTPHGLKTVMVGNPAVHVDLSQSDPIAFRKQYKIAHDSKLLLLLPGSRPAEIARLMPVFSDTAKRLAQTCPDLRIMLAVAPSVHNQVVAAVGALELNVQLIDSETDKYAAMMAADTALACSGTVSTELALCGCPMVIAYRVEPITYWIFKYISTIKHITMINIVAQADIIPEFIQQDCTAQNLSAALTQRLSDRDLCAHQVARQNAVLEQMGRHGRNTHELAAEAIIDFLRGTKKPAT
jgi:lipid-A-disaccharide synthase